MEIFNIQLEFDHNAFRYAVDNCIAEKGKGYVCVVDGNVLSQAQMNSDYNQVINGCLVNTCDSSFVAIMANHVYKTKYTSLNGPMIFEEYIEKSYKQLLLGNTEDSFNAIANELKKRKGDNSNLHYIPLPFCSVNEFDYQGIAEKVNELQPQIIWVSLGAPKQEIFMSKLQPFINSGVMFGIGAAFNYYSGMLDKTDSSIGGLRLIWLQRIFQEPKKQIRRCWNFVKVIPGLVRSEKKKARK